jgi:hypothetical protein
MFSVFEPFVFPGVRNVPLWGRVPDPVQHNLALCNTTLSAYNNTAATYVPERQYVQRVDLGQLCGCMVGSEPVDPRGHDAGVVIREMLARSLLSGCGPASGAPVPRARTRDEGPVCSAFF